MDFLVQALQALRALAMIILAGHKHLHFGKRPTAPRALGAPQVIYQQVTVSEITTIPVLVITTMPAETTMVITTLTETSWVVPSQMSGDVALSVVPLSAPLEPEWARWQRWSVIAIVLMLWALICFRVIHPRNRAIDNSSDDDEDDNDDDDDDSSNDPARSDDHQKAEGKENPDDQKSSDQIQPSRIQTLEEELKQSLEHGVMAAARNSELEEQLWEKVQQVEDGQRLRREILELENAALQAEEDAAKKLAKLARDHRQELSKADEHHRADLAKLAEDHDAELAKLAQDYRNNSDTADHLHCEKVTALWNEHRSSSKAGAKAFQDQMAAVVTNLSTSQEQVKKLECQAKDLQEQVAEDEKAKQANFAMVEKACQEKIAQVETDCKKKVVKLTKSHTALARKFQKTYVRWTRVDRKQSHMRAAPKVQDHDGDKMTGIQTEAEDIVNAAREENQLLRERIHGLDQSVAELTYLSNIKSLNADNKHAQQISQMMNEHGAKTSFFLDQISKWVDYCRSLEATNAKVRKDVVLLEKILQEHSSQQTAVGDLDEEMSEDMDPGLAEEEYEALRDSHQALVEENSSLKEKLRSLKPTEARGAGNKTLAKQMALLEAEMENLRNEKDDLQADNKKLAQQKVSLEEDVQALRDEQQKLEKGNEPLDEDDPLHALSTKFAAGVNLSPDNQGQGSGPAPEHGQGA